MRLILGALITISVLAILTAQASAGTEIVIAIRYLHAEGTSHSHLYLYRMITPGKTPAQFSRRMAR